MVNKQKSEKSKSRANKNTAQDNAVNAKSKITTESTAQLKQILSSTSKTTKERISAAANLGIIGTQDAEQVLLLNLENDDPFIRREVFKSLGMIGSGESLKRLNLAADIQNDVDQKQLDFARKIIAFREGDADQSDTPDINWKTQSLQSIEGEQVSKVVREIWGSNYGLELNPKFGFAFNCGRSTLNVLLNNALAPGSLTEDLCSKPMIAGLVTIRESEVQGYSVRYLLLTEPTDNGFKISVNRTSGDVVFSGNAIQDKKTLRLTMRDVGIERTPTEIIGTINNDRINLDLRTWQGKVQSKGHGEAVRI